jgi:hypothetical protein
MKLVSLSIRDFRNLAAVDLVPSPRATILLAPRLFRVLCPRAKRLWRNQTSLARWRL